MKLSTSVFSVAGLYLPLAAAATHEFHIYTGRENWWSGDGQVATSSCWFFDGQPSCDDVQNSVNGMLTLGDGDLSGSGRGCDCDGPGNACYGAPHEIERFEINVDEIGHVSKFSQQVNEPSSPTNGAKPFIRRARAAHGRWWIPTTRRRAPALQFGMMTSSVQLLHLRTAAAAFSTAKWRRR